jgi:hypothetical protein
MPAKMRVGTLRFAHPTLFPFIPAQAGIQPFYPDTDSGSPLEFTPAKAGAGTSG